MFWFVLGYGMVFSALCVAAMADEIDLRQMDVFGQPAGYVALGTYAVVLVSTPLITAWLTMDLLHRIRPRRWFDHRVRRRARLVAIGLGAGGVAAIGSTLGLVLLESAVPAWTLTAGVTVAVCGAAFFLLPAVRPAHCVECGYDLRDGVAAGRCPECGTWCVPAAIAADRAPSTDATEQAPAG